MNTLLNKYVRGPLPLAVRVLDFAKEISEYLENTAMPILNLALDTDTTAAKAFATNPRTKSLWKALDPMIETTLLTSPVLRSVMEFKPIENFDAYEFGAIDSMAKTMVAVSNFCVEIMAYDETGNTAMIQKFANYYAVGTMLVSLLEPHEKKTTADANDVLEAILKSLGGLGDMDMDDMKRIMDETGAHDCDNCDKAGGECEIEDEVRERQASGEFPKPTPSDNMSVDDLISQVGRSMEEGEEEKLKGENPSS